MLNSRFADKRGESFDAPGWGAVGQSGERLVVCHKADMIPLPPGSELMFLPGRTAIGMKGQSILPLPQGWQAVAAILPVGYTR